MPSKPKRPCPVPWCPNLTDGGRCPKHARQADQRRGSAASRGYDRRWQKYRLAFLQEHPLCECEECKREGRVTPAIVVDHKIPHKGDERLFWDPANHQAMSKACHDRKTASEDGGFGNRRAG